MAAVTAGAAAQKKRSAHLGDGYGAGTTNSLGAIRLGLAGAVLISHHWTLGWATPSPIGFDLGGVAVAGFFALSGFLIVASSQHNSTERYLWHRALRILPAYWVCLAMTAGVIAPLLWVRSGGGLHDFAATGEPFRYVRQFWHFGAGSGDVAGVYGSNPTPGAANPAIWTLQYECLAYLVVAALASVTVLRRWRWLPAVIVAGWLAAFTVGGFPSRPIYTGGLTQPFDLHQLGLCGLMFVLGAGAYVYRRSIPLDDRLGVLSLIVIVAALWGGWFFDGLALPAYAYLLLWAGVRLPGWLRWVGKRADYSYGFYIYGALTQQTLAAFGVPDHGSAVYLGACVAITSACAFASWHLIERRALAAKGWRYPTRRANTVAAAPATFGGAPVRSR